ncbi:hypothetical protein H0H92_002898 [Tricholoma furcatifolium]|nr:hypothetical protein H0H92_002898 [Tricholoma furcatifolium]
METDSVFRPMALTTSDTPSQQVLTNEELLQRIFEEFPFEPFDEQMNNVTRSHLLRAALTCKAFVEPALNVLWKSINTFIPLFKLLPSFKIVQDDYVFRGPISDADWQRYYYYARKVKEFIYPGFQDDSKVDNHAKVRLAQLWRSPLLPTLRRYTCYDVRSLGPFIHPLFMSPTLEFLKLGFITDAQDASVGTLLSMLVDEVPRLRSLLLTGTLSTPSLMYVVQFKHLRTLDLLGMGEMIDSHFLSLVSDMEELEELVIDVYNSPLSTFPVSNGFRRLKKLHVTAFHSTIEQLLLDLSDDVALESLGFITPPAPLPTTWESDFSSLVHTVMQRWLSSLRRITIDREWSSYMPLSLPKSLICPLFRLPNIEYFVISEFLVPFFDEDILELASAWPRLKHLHIPHDDHTTPRTSFSMLYTLAKCCPQLEHLEIPLDTRHLPSLPPLSTERPHPSPLQILYIANDNPPTETRDLLLSARHLDRLFPRLRKLGRSSLKDLESSTWDKIFAMIQAFRSVRAELYYE